jgi:pSer/pThr/pTyr-binding forkhead associated (FHA) protein
MDILSKARKLESRISRTLDGAVEGFVGRSPRQPVEIVHAVLECAEQQVQPAGRGRRVFPFNHVVVHVLAPSRSERARFAAVAETPPSLQQRLVDRLESAGCHPGRIELQVTYASRAKPDWLAPEYHVAFDRVEIPPAVEPPQPARVEPPRIDLGVVAGSAERRTYTFSGGRIDIGRRAEVLDHRQQLIRRNHIAFTEGESDANRSVSRKHAHIAYSASSGEYRVRDDGSVRGTAVLRHGQTIRVPQGARGIRLVSGDEIVLGDARLRVRLR